MSKSKLPKANRLGFQNSMDRELETLTGLANVTPAPTPENRSEVEFLASLEKVNRRHGHSLTRLAE